MLLPPCFFCLVKTFLLINLDAMKKYCEKKVLALNYPLCQEDLTSLQKCLQPSRGDSGIILFLWEYTHSMHIILLGETTNVVAIVKTLRGELFQI